MMKGWEKKKLGDVCYLYKEQGAYPGLQYIGLENIESNSGVLISSVDASEIKSSTFKFNKGDVLYGRLRPYLKKVIIAPFEGCCSTEIFPIKPTKISADFLKYWFISEDTTTKIVSTCSGCRMPRANMNQVMDFDILCPSLSEQQRIVDILDKGFAKIEQIKANAEKNFQQAKDLFQATLREMSNPRNMNNTIYLKDVYSIRTGKLNANCAEEGGKYPFFTCSKETFAINTYAFDCEAILLAGNNASGDFNVKHYNGKFNAYQRTYVIETKSKNWCCRILYYVLLYYLDKLKKMSVGANTRFLKLGMIENIKINNFSLSEQQTIVSKLDKLSTICKQLEYNYSRITEECEALKQSLLKKAFSGEL